MKYRLILFILSAIILFLLSNNRNLEVEKFTNEDFLREYTIEGYRK